MKLEEPLTKPASDQLDDNSPINSSCNNAFVQKVYKIGMAVFSFEIRQRQNLRNFNGFVLQALQKDILKLKGPDENKSCKWPKVFSFMKETFIQELHFQKNPQILKEITPILFHQLKELNVFVANIENYEAFTFLNCPKLQKINLIYNNCSNFKALNKVYMPSVKIICIYMKQTGNWTERRFQTVQSHSIQDFERWGFQLNELRLEKQEADRVMMEDLSRLAKAKSSLQNIYYCGHYRIEQKEVVRRIRSKGVKFYLFQEEREQFNFREVNI